MTPGTDGATNIGWHIGDVPANTAEATYVLTFTATVEAAYEDGTDVVDGVNEPLINAARAYYNIASDAATPTSADPVPLAPLDVFELRGRRATAEFDIRTPHINVNKTIADREPFTWTEPVEPFDEFTTYPASPGERLTWVLDITNDGSAPAADLKIGRAHV